MPKYSVRIYTTYMDEFIVEAADKDEAEELVEDYPSPAHRLDQSRITKTVEREFVDFEETLVNELDAEGRWVEEE